VNGLFNGQPIYNEIDAHACAWLRNLCRAGYLRGRVVEADVRALDPADVARGCRFHAFAGIGMWEYALNLADWPDELPVWTGSCPCQPFSVAGRGGGTSDSRHLWPAWFRLIRECRPPVIFGEQVASRTGRAWFDSVSADLEGVGYAVGAADLCAAGVGAPHIRQRLFFVAYRPGRMEYGDESRLEIIGEQQARAEHETAERAGTAGVMGDVGGFWSDADWLLCRDGKARPVEPGTFPLAHGRSGRVAVVCPAEQGATEAQETHWYNRRGALQCIGNAIVPQIAAVFIEAALRSIYDEFV
jgi:DNA (cytosine-5)-methyltransferase 1